MNNLGTLLSWDTHFWGFQIARLNDAVLHGQSVGQIVSWCRSQQVRCAYLLVDDTDEESRQKAEAGSFIAVDTRVTLVRSVGDHASFGRCPTGVDVRQSVPADIPHLRAVAHASHRQGRFHVDPSFPQTRCDELYAVWIERSCQGYADAVFVGEIDGLPVGYLSCHLTRSEAGRIGLFGVDVSARRRGLGSRLIHDAADWFGVQGVSKISVVTQRRNDAAMRLYKKHGFKTESKGHWYHLWPESVDG